METLPWGPSIPSAGPQGLKLEAQSAESGGGALGRKGPGLAGPQELGDPVHWTAEPPVSTPLPNAVPAAEPTALKHCYCE